MNRILTLLWISFSFLSIYGMDARLEKINSIKKSADYFYGEATMATQKEAMSLAFEMLQKEVLSWAQRENCQLTVTSIADINNLADTVTTRRANMYRVFAYVRKSALIQSSPMLQPKQEPVSQDSLVTDSVRKVIKQRLFGKNRLNDALYRIKSAKNFFELKEIMQPLRTEGKIADFGKYSTAEHVELCYLIIYDPAGNIRALLGKGDKIRTNLITGRDDSEKNYRGCGAIWFTLNE